MSRPKLYLDTETCGLHGMPVLFQYAVDDGPIRLYEPWKQPINVTLALIEWFATHTVVGFNLAFDWFQLCKLYTTLHLCKDECCYPEEHIDEIAMLEPAAQDGPCLKPAVLDLMLHARKGPYQSLMNRDPIRIRRVPRAIAQGLADELEKRVQVDGIYFAKEVKKGPHWKLFDSRQLKGEAKGDFQDIVLTFRPSGALKVLAEHALGAQATVKFADIELDRKYRPIEYGYAPTALAVSTPDKGWQAQRPGLKGMGYAWPGVIAKHIEHWHTCHAAREYARMDIVYTRGLDEHFGYPETNDDDSVLACMVAALRWRGFAFDHAAIAALREKAQTVIARSPINVNKPKEVRRYLSEVMTPEEAVFISETTGKEKLEKIEKAIGKDWRIRTEDEPCGLCTTGCPRCAGSGFLKPGPHPASLRAKELLEVKRAKKEDEFYAKLQRAGKLHADFNVIGAKSSRMSGASGMNAQAVKKTKEVRRCFNLAWPGYQLCGGDFDSFEVTIAEACYNDPDLRAALLSGKKIHGLFGESVYQKSYDEVLASEGQDFDMYSNAKRGVFLDMYGGEAQRLSDALGIPESAAHKAQLAWQARFPGIGVARERIKQAFGCLLQPGGKGTAIEWVEPQLAAYTLLGFPRYFTLENNIIESLYWLAGDQETLQRLAGDNETLIQRDRKRRAQTPAGAAATAIYAAAFSCAKANVRAAGNHEIQGTGAGICKRLQRRIWDHQPAGVHTLRVAPMNVHDELMVPCLPEYIEPVAETVRETVESFRDKVPLIGMTWFRKLKDWAGKKGGGAEGKLSISPI